MYKVLHVFTMPSRKGSVGGISTLINGYLEQAVEFETHSYSVSLFDYHAKYTSSFSKVNNALYGIQQIVALKRHLREKKYDIIHVHTSMGWLFLKDVMLIKNVKASSNIPVILTIHVGLAATVFSRIAKFKDCCISILNNCVDRICFLSNRIREEFVDIGLKSEIGTVLYNFHNLGNLCFDDHPAVSSDSLHLLYVGHVTKDKGIRELLCALSEIPFAYNIRICGQVKDPSISDSFYSFVSSNSKVYYSEYVAGEEKRRVYQQADVLILPSYHEGLPLVILEALASSTAIITTRVGAIPEILSEENAVWVDVGSSEQIKDAIYKLYNDRDALSKMKRENLNLSVRFSAASHIKQLCGVYDNSLRHIK